MSAPYLAVPEYPDRSGLDLAGAIERIADKLSDCAAKAAAMSNHEAEWCGADAILVRLRAVVDELQNVVGPDMNAETATAILAALDEMAAAYAHGDGMSERGIAARLMLYGFGVREHDSAHVAMKQAQARAAIAKATGA